MVAALAVGNQARDTEDAAEFVSALEWALTEWLMHTDAAPEVVAHALYGLILSSQSLEPDEAITYTMSRLAGLSSEARQRAASVLLGASAPPLHAEIATDIEFD